MRVGQHKKTKKTWKIGDMEISETSNFKYLGDIITSHGKNSKNIESGKNKINESTISIKSLAASETLNRIETSILRSMHNTVNIPALLTNSESWNLTKSERD